MTTAPTPALSELLAHTRWVEELARSLVRDPEAAQDLAQSTLLAALESRGERPGNARAWLGKVMRNLARERWRREAARPRVEKSGARAEALPAADELVLRAECERRVVAAVLSLDEPHRSTLLLRYFESLSPEEIARRSNAPLATVTRRVTRAHAHLRAKLSRDREGASWTLAIAPLLHRLEVGAPAAPHVPGVLAMSATAKLLAAAAAIVILVLGLRTALAPERTSTASELVPASSPAAPLVDSTSPTDVRDARTPAEAAEPAPAPPPAAKAPEAPKPDVLAAAPGQGCRIFGRVFRPDDRPAAGRQVRMLFMPRGPVKNTKTDADGRFDERDLAPGTWALSTWPDEAELQELGRAAGEDTLNGMMFIVQRTLDVGRGAEVEVVLGQSTPESVHVTGRLLSKGAPVGAYVTWFPDGRDAMDRMRVSVASKEKGFDFRLDQPGRYDVVASLQNVRAEWVVEVPAGPTFARDLELPSGELRGRVVTPDGAPVVGARVALTPRAGHWPRNPTSTVEFSPASADDGTFSFRCLPPARYAVGVNGGKVGEDKRRAGAVALPDVDLRQPLANDLEIVVPAASAVRARGRVVAKDGNVVNTWVYVFDEAGEPLNPLGGVAGGKDGLFELFPLAPGRYFAVGACGTRWTEPARFTVPAQGDPPTFELVLAPAARITVDIRADEPAWIDLRDANGCCISALFDNHVFDRSVFRDWSATSHTLYVPAGSYDVRVVGASGRLANRRVEAAPGASERVDLSR